MSRTRGASTGFQDDGVLLGKGGEPINPHPMGAPRLDRHGNYVSPAAANIKTPMKLSGATVLHGPGAQAVPVAGTIIGYRADKKSWSRNLEAHELAKLIDMLLRQPGDLTDGFVVDATPDEFARMDGNLKRHFMPVRGE